MLTFTWQYRTHSLFHSKEPVLSNTKPLSNDLYTILHPVSCKISSFCLWLLPNRYGEIRDSRKHRPPLISFSHCCEVLWGPLILGSLWVHRTVNSSAGQRRTRVALLRFLQEIPIIHRKILYFYFMWLFETISCTGFKLKGLFLSVKFEENHPQTNQISVFLHCKKYILNLCF